MYVCVRERERVCGGCVCVCVCVCVYACVCVCDVLFSLCSHFWRVLLQDLKKPLKIKYVGGGEQGLDLGGEHTREQTMKGCRL
jgi:hypothetical protein